MTDQRKRRLSAEGQIYVTAAAAQQYMADMPGVRGIEEARRELTEIMLDAYRTEGGAVRARNRQRALDLSARVVQEGRLLVVVSVTCRDLTEGDPDRPSRARRIVGR